MEKCEISNISAGNPNNNITLGYQLHTNQFLIHPEIRVLIGAESHTWAHSAGLLLKKF